MPDPNQTAQQGAQQGVVTPPAEAKCEAPDGVKHYADWVKNAETISAFIGKLKPSSAYCTDGPQVAITGASKPETKEVIVKVDPVKDIAELQKIAANLKKSECKFIAKQFLAQLKDHGCNGVSCSAYKKRSCHKKKKRKTKCG